MNQNERSTSGSILFLGVLLFRYLFMRRLEWNCTDKSHKETVKFRAYVDFIRDSLIYQVKFAEEPFQKLMQEDFERSWKANALLVHTHLQGNSLARQNVTVRDFKSVIFVFSCLRPNHVCSISEIYLFET